MRFAVDSNACTIRIWRWAGEKEGCRNRQYRRMEMFELPEFVTLAKQINATLKGKTIQRGQLGNSPHKFVWYNRSHEEFDRLAKGKTIGETRAKGKWLFIPLDPGYVLLLGECGGKVLYHPPGAEVPKKYHLYITFEDDSFLTATTQMWGAMELYEKGQEQNREYVKGMRTTPTEPEFTVDYLCALIDDLAAGKKRSAKGLLTQEQIIPGLGNAIAQDILFRARLHPRHAVADLSTGQRRALYHAIVDTVREVIEQGGRNDEYDLHNNRGGYVRIMDKNAVGQPCPECGGTIEKIQYLGGACYLCPNCQE
jgi:formamidopyrimidine-DNA glycosylase